MYINGTGNYNGII